MLNVRPPQPETPPSDARFRVLLTEDRARPDEHWTRQVTAMLRPLGVDARIAADGREALQVLETTVIHAAVIDLNTPAPQGASGASAHTSGGGLWLMQVIHRLPTKPPVVVVNSQSYSQRQVQRLLNQALDLGAFSVINGPVRIEAVLGTFQRLLERAYGNAWPQAGKNPPN